ncbi:MAG: NYN domain-containing protein [Candidatus Aminicenantes bacterium]|nr:NYN domain-containing protein [Candidatus Aminicenantes bacterium]
MPYIIDGNNLIGSSPDISLEDSNSRKEIVAIVKKFQKKKNSKIIVVFDGEPDTFSSEENPTEKIVIKYPPIGDSADDEIKRILDGYTYFRDVVLVTSDRELKDIAKKKGAKVINSIEFYYELKRVYRATGRIEMKQKRIDTELSDGEVDQWMKIFDE